MSKPMVRVLIALTMCAGWCASPRAAELPAPGQHDARIRYVNYKKDDVIVITVRRGTATRIVLEETEKIVRAGTGFPADCKKPELEWCVVADVGHNEVWVKPKDSATDNNLELKTDKRDYSFEFRVLDASGNGRGSKRGTSKALAQEPMFRVIFRYTTQLPLSAMLASAGRPAQANEQDLLKERLSGKPKPRNWKYSMQVLPGGEDIAPSLIFDDGRFTYFRFPANREIPSLYYISPTGEESRVNFHMEEDLVVVQRTGRQFVLRLGQAVVGIWNDAYDADGVGAREGVTVEGLTRTTR
jgi:type IV secretion system protein VirB9